MVIRTVWPILQLDIASSRQSLTQKIARNSVNYSPIWNRFELIIEAVNNDLAVRIFMSVIQHARALVNTSQFACVALVDLFGASAICIPQCKREHRTVRVGPGPIELRCPRDNCLATIHVFHSTIGLVLFQFKCAIID